MSSPQAPQTSYRAVVMGVAGSGKTTIGEQLAARLGLPFEDADCFHPPQNVRKMSEGTPLTDADREPWLESIGRWLVEHPDGAIVSCSALKRAYRDTLRGFVPDIPFLHPHGTASLVLERMSRRTDHFMPVELLESQYATLEPLTDDEAGITLDLRRSVDELVQDCVAHLQGHHGQGEHGHR